MPAMVGYLNHWATAAPSLALQAQVCSLHRLPDFVSKIVSNVTIMRLIRRIIVAEYNNRDPYCFTLASISAQRFLKLEQALEFLNNLDSNEIDVEIVVLPPDASKLTDKDEWDEQEINTGTILLKTMFLCL
ncbi:hypothetical protein TNCV_204691 [Trichonephila clavipes]|nr:hypothetical protein TNCV_204691 [Trichonephila clavipes]